MTNDRTKETADGKTLLRRVHEVPDSVTGLAGQIEIALHEHFDRVQSVAPLISVEFGQPYLLVAIQNVLRSPGVEVEFIAKAE